MTARVLLVDDDASIRRFVALALEELEVELVEAANVPQAREQLAAGRFALVITDLMMPGGPGSICCSTSPTIPNSAARRGWRYSAPAECGHAGAPGEFDVWRQLGKPIALTELETMRARCDRRGRAAPATVAAAELDGLSAAEQATVERHFAGDRALFLAYRASCVAQFANDLRQGDDAFARADAPALRRLAHSLKSVLLTLGQPEASERARQLEDAGARADWEAARPLWQACERSWQTEARSAADLSPASRKRACAHDAFAPGAKLSGPTAQERAPSARRPCGLLPDVDPDGLLEYSVVYTDRALKPHVEEVPGRDARHRLGAQDAYRGRAGGRGAGQRQLRHGIGGAPVRLRQAGAGDPQRLVQLPLDADFRDGRHRLLGVGDEGAPAQGRAASSPSRRRRSGRWSRRSADKPAVVFARTSRRPPAWCCPTTT